MLLPTKPFTTFSPMRLAARDSGTERAELGQKLHRPLAVEAGLRPGRGRQGGEQEKDPARPGRGPPSR